ncbi:MAG: hypothetical protein PHU72_06320 [Dethiosulfovibrio sp.]|nr:hypothetical protein [Dethiosulfovibrio sp.]
MKKTISLVLALLLALGGTIFVMVSRPSPEPGAFLPHIEDGSLQVHLRRVDQAMEWILDLDEFIRSQDLPPSDLGDLIPLVGRGAIQAGLSLDGYSDRFFMALEVIDSSKAMEVSQAIRGEAVLRGWEASPLKVSLPHGIAPLFVLSKDDVRSCWGLWRRGAGSVLLAASSPQDLSYMTPEWDLPVRQTSGANWVRVDLPGSSAELSLSRSEERILLSSWSQNVSGDFELGEIPLYGGGSLAALAAFSGLSSFLLPEGISSSFLDDDIRLLLDNVIYLANSVGLTEEDLLEALDGRISFVLGSRASGLMGAMPGGYVLLEGVSPDLGAMVVGEISRLNLPFGAGPLKKPDWQGGLSFKLPLTAVLAYGDRGFLAGIVDPDDLDRRPTVPDRIADSVKRARQAALSVDVRGLLEILEIYRSMASLLDDDLASIMGSLMEILSPWDRFELYTPSVGRFELSLYRLRN